MLWDDSGTGGKRGSIWQINSLALLFAKEGHEAPEPPFLELTSKSFLASEGLVANLDGVAQNKQQSGGGGARDHPVRSII